MWPEFYDRAAVLRDLKRHLCADAPSKVGVNVSGSIRHDHRISAADLSDDELARIAAGGLVIEHEPKSDPQRLN